MPARLKDIERALAAFGAVLELPNRGSHYKVVRGSETYPLPAHNGTKTEIDDWYIRGLCRQFGFDEKEFRRKL